MTTDTTTLARLSSTITVEDSPHGLRLVCQGYSSDSVITLRPEVERALLELLASRSGAPRRGSEASPDFTAPVSRPTFYRVEIECGGTISFRKTSVVEARREVNRILDTLNCSRSGNGQSGHLIRDGVQVGSYAIIEEITA